TAGDGAAVGSRQGFHRRRVRLDRADAPDAVARRGRAAKAGRGGDLPGQSAAGQGRARLSPGGDAARRQPSALGRPLHARRDLPRRDVTAAGAAAATSGAPSRRDRAAADLARVSAGSRPGDGSYMPSTPTTVSAATTLPL